MAAERTRFEHMIPCLQRDYTRLSQIFSWTLMRAFPHLSLTKSVFDVLKGYFEDEMLALCFSFQSKYLGMSAWKCPGAFAMLSYIEHAYGVYHTEGGLSQISTALGRLAEERGAALRLSTPAKRLILSGRQVRGVELEDGEQILCDDVVINADFGQAMTDLVPPGTLKRYTPENLKKLDVSCSTYMLYLGLDKVYPLEHHTILFARDYRRNVEEIFERKVASDDLSFYVRNASVTDPTLAPAGKSSLYVLVPVPNLRGDLDWEDQAPKYRALTLKAIADRLGIKDLEEHIEVEKTLNPVGWRNELSVYDGATFNLAHNLKQIAFWRPKNQFEELDNCYLVGGGTHPGSGLPTIFESARISANLICRKHKIPFITKELKL